jgi:hypothetical protein
MWRRVMKIPALHLMWLWAVGASGAGEVTIAVRGGPAECAIVLPAVASPSQVFAAEELRRFVGEMTGVTLPIVPDDGPLPARAILLGETRHTGRLLGGAADLAALGDDGFRLKTCPPHVLVVGGPVRGTLYGVYEMLERFGGCRWYASWHSVIPRHDAWAVPPVDETQVPAFVMREPFWFDMFDDDLAARNRCNGNAMRLAEKHGGKIRFGEGLFVHTFNTLCPPEEFFDAHPEYFSEIDGRRVRERTQLCLTNPDVLRIVTERLLARIRKDPGAKLFSVSQNDWQNFCTCPPCRAIDEREGSHAGTMIGFVNRVAEAVEKEFPGVWIETLAYQYTRKPPKTIRPRHNVVPRLCSIECDFSKPLSESAFEQNRRFVEELRAWGRMTDKLYVWDYTTNFREYISPFPNVLALRGNVRLFRDNGVVGLFEQGAYQGRHGDFAELKAWLLAKWLWDPERQAGPLLEDFFSGYYGAAAPIVRRYFDEVHGFHGDPAGKPLRIFDDIRTSAIPDEFLVRAVRMWAEAEIAVKDSPPHWHNVRMGAIPALYARLMRLPPHDEIGVWVTENPGLYDVPPERRALAKELLARFGEGKNVRISESLERHEKVLGDIARWATATPHVTAPVQSSAIVEEAQLTLANRGEWGDFVKDPLAEDGAAMKLFNTHYEWCTTLPFGRVAFDPGKKYRFRVRLRVESAGGVDGEAFWAGVYDARNRRSCGGIDRKVVATGEEYAWYDVAEWVPERDHYFWIGPGRFDKKGGARSAVGAVYVDKLELARVE